MGRSLERILESNPELDTPLYRKIYQRQEKGIPPREVSALRRRLLKLFVLGGVSFAASACVSPASAIIFETTSTPDATPDEIDSGVSFSPVTEATEVSEPATPTEILSTPTKIPTKTPTQTPTETPTLTPEPTRTFTPEPTSTPALEVFGGRVITKEEFSYLSALGGGEEMLELVDERLRELPSLRPFLLMGAQAILSGQTGIVEVLPPAGEGEPPWFVFRQTINGGQKREVSVFNLVNREEISLKEGGNLTVIAKLPNGEFLVMYEQWQDGHVTYYLGTTSGETEDVLANFKEEERLWQPNAVAESVWQEVQEGIREAEIAEPAQVVILVKFLNLRAGPGTNYGIMGGLKQGEKVAVVGQSENGWYRTVWTDKAGIEHEGWFSGLSEYVETNKAAQNVPVVPEEEIPSAPEPKVESSKILPVAIDAQDFSLSCESSASAMVAAYFRPKPPDGYSSWEGYFIRVIPQNCNPHRGYRGKIDGWLSLSCDSNTGWGYGVYAEPVATAFQEAGIPAQVEYGVDYGAVERAIKAGKPVIVWISGRNEPTQYETDPETGQRYVLIEGEHAWTVIGVRGETSQRQFLINDPWKGRQYWVKGFPRWHDFNGMRVVVG